MHAARTVFTAAVLASTIATGCDLNGDRIGSEGGLVVSDDGRMALEIPEGALDEAVEITITVTDAPEGAISPLYVIEPMGLTFARPTALVFDYDDEDLGSRDPQSMSMVAHRELNWAYLADEQVDVEDQTITASLMALSAVTVVVEN